MSDRIISADWTLPELAHDNNKLNKSYFESDEYKKYETYYKLKNAINYILNESNFDQLSLLDVGCGCGWHGVYLKKENIFQIQYNGMDLSQHMCDNAIKNCCNEGTFTVLDITKFPSEKTYDIVMEAAVLELVSDWKSALKNMLLSSNEWFIAHRLFFTKGETKIECVETYRKLQDIRTHIGMGEFQNILNENGFEIKNSDIWNTSGYNMGTFIVKRI